MSDSLSFRTVFKWTGIPFLNFIMWYYLGLHQRGCPVPFVSSPSSSDYGVGLGASGSNKVVYNYSMCDSFGHGASSAAVTTPHSHLPHFISSNVAESYHFGKLNMGEFEKYKKDELVHLKSASAKVIELSFRKHQMEQSCTKYVHILIENKPFTCLAVVASSSNPGSLNLLRFNKDQKKTGRVFDKLHPAPAGKATHLFAFP